MQPNRESAAGPSGVEPAAADRIADLDLARRMIEGDQEAFELFSDHYIPALYRFAARRLRGDRELTREIVQATVCKALAQLASFRGEAALMTWLCACCRSEIASHYRRRGRAPREVELVENEVVGTFGPHSTGAPGPERALLRREASELVHMALDLLPVRHGHALEWKYLEQVPVREIARRLGIGLKAAESLLTRARTGFRQHYLRLIEDLGPRGGRTAQAEGSEGKR